MTATALTRFAVTAVVIIEAEDQYAAQETIGNALIESPAQSVVILETEVNGSPVVVEHTDVATDVIDLRAAGRAFHCVADATQLLRGDYVTAEEFTQARRLIEICGAHIGALYLFAIRERRYAGRVELANSALMTERGAHLREIAALKADLTAAVQGRSTADLTDVRRAG
jgi:hypothetical protein